MSLHAPAVRPTFDLEVALTPTQVADALSELLDHPINKIVGRRAGHHFMLTVPDRERHFWSPWLTVEARTLEDEDTLATTGSSPNTPRTRVHGRFSPAPNLWTAIMFTHLALLTVAFFAVMFGLSQLTLKQPPHALWVTAGCVLASLLLWWVSLLGQRIAHDQMHTLRDAVDDALSAI